MSVAAPTVQDLLTLALQDAGVIGMGQQPIAQDNNNALLRLNWMIAEWRRQRWLVWNLTNILLTSTGAQSYSVGPGGDFNTGAGTQRPDRIEYAYFRQLVPGVPNQTDYPLEILTSWEDYNRIGIKRLGTFPTSCFYSPDFPLGQFYPWPIPQANIYAINLTVKLPITTDLTLTTTLALPEEYNSALHWNMVVRLRAAYDLPPRPDHVAFAKNTLQVLRGANNAITRLQLPGEILRPGIYNPYSDNFR